MAIIEEKLDYGLRASLMSNFTGSTEAVLELVDNAVSDRIPGKRLEIIIEDNKKTLSITNRFGRGMGMNELHDFLNWGMSKDRQSYDIGQYSQGGKAAIGFLGDSWSLAAKKDGETKGYIIEEKSWTSGRGPKTYIPKEITILARDGMVSLKINKWRGKVKHVRIREDVLKKQIASVYSPLLTSGDVVISFNKETITPCAVPCSEDFEPENFEFIVSGQRVHGWIGRRPEKETSFKGGMRCYSKGRMIQEREYFEHRTPESKQSLSLLVGEVHLDPVPVNMNKTNYLRDSNEWQEVQAEMYKKMEPHIQDLLKKKDDDLPTNEENQEAKSAQDYFNKYLSMRAELPRSENGDTTEQKPDEGGTVEMGKSRGPVVNHPETPLPPPQTSHKSPERKMRALRNGIDLVIRPLGSDIRITEVEEDDKRKFIVNNQFGLYKAFRNKKSLRLYILESMCLQWCRKETTSVDGFIQEMDIMLADMYNIDPNMDRDIGKAIKNQSH